PSACGSPSLIYTGCMYRADRAEATDRGREGHRATTVSYQPARVALEGYQANGRGASAVAWGAIEQRSSPMRFATWTLATLPTRRRNAPATMPGRFQNEWGTRL